MSWLITLALYQTQISLTIRKATNVSLSEVQAKLKELTEEEMDEFLSKKLQEVEEETDLQLIVDNDSSISNVIQFKPRGTYH